MKFETKKDEFMYYSLKAIEAEQKGDRKNYLIFLKIAAELLKEIEEEERASDE